MFSTPGFPPAASWEESGDAKRPERDGGRQGPSLPAIAVSGRSMTEACATPGARQKPIQADCAPLPTEAQPSIDRLLAELYRTESPKLVRIISRQTGNQDDARDLVHDVFFRLARLFGRGDVLDRPHAYLRRIASNLVKDRAKSAARRSTALHIVADEDVLPGHDQQRLLESRDMLRRLEAAVARLRPRTREVFTAHRIEGLAYAEIAERTGLSLKGVEKQMSKALIQLDRLLNRS